MNIDSQIRPRTISEFFDCAFKRVMLDFIEKGQINHSFIFYGPPGMGKTTSARALASYLFTGSPDSEYDLDESQCYIEVNAPQYSGVNEMRTLMMEVHQPPLYDSKVVLTIDEAHKLTRDAQSVLLKPFEEPPSHLYIVLCTTEINKIDAAIRDRAVRVEFEYPKDPRTYVTGYAYPKIVKATGVKVQPLDDSAISEIVDACQTAPSYRSLAIATYEYIMTGTIPREVASDETIGSLYKVITSGTKVQLREALSRITDYEATRIALTNYVNAVIVGGLAARTTEETCTLLKVLSILKPPLEYSAQKADLCSRLIHAALVARGKDV